MKIKFCGASTGVTGSCHMLTSGNHKILLDCGQFQGGKVQNAMNFESFPFDPAEIETVVLSHAHIDHCGRLPLLVKRGFKGDIYCTSATADLLQVMLRDSAYIHEKEAEQKNRKAERSGRALVEPLYRISDAEEALKLVKPVLYDQLIEINDSMRIVYNDAGHILGSAITELWVKEGDKEAKIVFTGDLGMMDRPILRDPVNIKKADYVIMETTYGNRIHPENSASINQLLEIIVKTVKRGGKVIIPSFAVGRTQELIYELNKVYDHDNEYRKILEDINVYVDSPMATTATEVFRKNADVFDEETRNYILSGDNPLDFKNLFFTRSTAESIALNNDKTPKIIISASGMCEAGRIRHHLKHNLWDPKNSVVFVGYQAEGTLGRYLIEGAKSVTLFGEEILVNAEIYNLEGFSGHADQNGLLHWISAFEKKPSQVFLVHGETKAKKDFAELIHEKLGYNPEVVMGNTEFELDMVSSEIVNKEFAEEEAESYENVQEIREQIANIHNQLDHIIYHANMIMNDETSKDKVIKINNMVQELEKATINLGSVVTEEEEIKNPVTANLSKDNIK